MSQEEDENGSTYYDAIAVEYDSQVDGAARNRRNRERFQALTAPLIRRDLPLLDFGCGTGLDSKHYAGAGYKVLAYDTSPGMVAVLCERCADEITAGTVTACAGGLDVLREKLAQFAPIGGVVAHLAVLNHIRDLRPTFALLADALSPGGVIVATMLNPFYWRDMLSAWWWQGAPASVFTGAIRVAGDVTTYRHFPSAIQRMASPMLTLEAHGIPADVPDDSPKLRTSLGRTLASNFYTIILRKLA